MGYLTGSLKDVSILDAMNGNSKARMLDRPHVIRVAAEAGRHPNRLIGYSPTLDDYRRYLTDSPTPTRIATLLKSIDTGDIAASVEICEELEGKDAHLQGIASRRREALTALDWRIEPEAATSNRQLANDAAAFCTHILRGIRNWPTTLEHLATGIGPGIAVTELIWYRGRLVDTTDVPGHRLAGDIGGQTADVFIETEHNLIPGIRAATPKFIVHAPHARAGGRMRVTLIRATAWLWVIKHFGIADWTAFVETYGMPWRHAKIGEGVPDDVKPDVEAAVRDMASDGYLVTSDKIELSFLEANRQSQPYEGLVDWVERKMSVLWLGQTLTTEHQGVGSLALGRVHDNVRAGITFSDMQQEARTIREQVLRPMCWFRWPMVSPQDLPVPHWKREIIEEKNLDAERLNLERLRYADERSVKIDEGARYELLGVPQPRSS